MGIIYSRFRRKKTTVEILDDLDKQIKDIEQYGQTTEQRHKKIVGVLIIYSVALYIVTATIFYFYFFPAKFYDQLFYITPLLIFPVLILLIKKIVTWYYKRKISRNQEKLVHMKEEKKKILDEVTENETFKKAKEILIKFAPDQLSLISPLRRQAQFCNDTTKFGTPQSVILSSRSESELRRRNLVTAALESNYSANKVQLAETTLQSPLSVTLSKKNDTLLPRPILPQQRSYIDRLVEYVVGDGPSNRYALICRQCESHNGMALKEEFEYFAFRCCYCNFWNPARKQKPSAPKLELDNKLATPKKLSLQIIKPAKTSINDDEKIIQSDTDSDIEVVEKLSVTPESEDYNLDFIETNKLESNAILNQKYPDKNEDVKLSDK